MSKGWLEELVHEKYGLLPTDKAQQAIIEINKCIKQLEDALRNNENEIRLFNSAMRIHLKALEEEK